ncbi:MFS transporter [Actinomadura spongiicola]|uniref:MFS transporter n=1 Tax=Actinomadura spongiicola TaxID=2303421 RepID=UPI0011C0EA16|nr:MFS transporter [Actinomadura spongiicola]
MRSPRSVVVLLVAALVNAATFCVITYLEPLVTDVAGCAAGWVPVTLALFGLGSFTGVTVAGRLSDARPMRVLLPGGSLSSADGRCSRSWREAPWPSWCSCSSRGLSRSPWGRR